MSDKLYKALNQQVANLTVLYTKLHHYHWFIKGTDFFTLHEQFQKEYEEIAEMTDELAERLIMIGGTPLSTMKDYLKETTLKEDQGKLKTNKATVKNLVEDYEQLAKEIKEAIEVADDEDDDVTEDLLIGILKTFDKKIWMYKAFLG